LFGSLLVKINSGFVSTGIYEEGYSQVFLQWLLISAASVVAIFGVLLIGRDLGMVPQNILGMGISYFEVFWPRAYHILQYFGLRNDMPEANAAGGASKAELRLVLLSKLTDTPQVQARRPMMSPLMRMDEYESSIQLVNQLGGQNSESLVYAQAARTILERYFEVKSGRGSSSRSRDDQQKCERTIGMAVSMVKRTCVAASSKRPSKATQMAWVAVMNIIGKLLDMAATVGLGSRTADISVCSLFGVLLDPRLDHMLVQHAGSDELVELNPLPVLTAVQLHHCKTESPSSPLAVEMLIRAMTRSALRRIGLQPDKDHRGMLEECLLVALGKGAQETHLRRNFSDRCRNAVRQGLVNNPEAVAEGIRVTISAYEDLGCKSPTQFDEAKALFSARAAQRTSSVKSSVGSVKGNKRRGNKRGHTTDDSMTDVELEKYANWYWGVYGALEDSNHACSDAGTCHNTALVATRDALLFSIGAAESEMSTMNLCFVLASMMAIPCLDWKDSRNDDEATRKIPGSQSFDLLIWHALGEKQPKPAQADADAVAAVGVEAAKARPLIGEHTRTELLATGLSWEVAEFAQSDILKQQATALAIALEGMQRGHTQPTAWPTALVSPLAEIGLSGVDALRCTNLLVVEMVLAHCGEMHKGGQGVRAYVKGTCKEAEIKRTAQELARVLSHLERTRNLLLLQKEAAKDGGSVVAGSGGDSSLNGGLAGGVEANHEHAPLALAEVEGVERFSDPPIAEIGDKGGRGEPSSLRRERSRRGSAPCLGSKRRGSFLATGAVQSTSPTLVHSSYSEPLDQLDQVRLENSQLRIELQQLHREQADLQRKMTEMEQREQGHVIMRTESTIAHRQRQKATALSANADKGFSFANAKIANLQERHGASKRANEAATAALALPSPAAAPGSELDGMVSRQRLQEVTARSIAGTRNGKPEPRPGDNGSKFALIAPTHRVII
jgi:hypothetical protein